MSIIGSKLAAYLRTSLGYSYRRVLEQAVLMGLVAHVLFVVVFIMISVRILVLVNIISCFCYITAYALSRRRMFNSAYIIACLELVSHAIIAVMILGWKSGFHIYILMVVPAMFFPPYFKMSVRLAASFLLGILYCGLYYFSHQAGPIYYLPAVIILSFNYFNMFNLFLLLTSLSYIMQRALKNLEERLGNMNEELSFMANVDPLTKILNRRSMERFIFTAVNTGRSAGSQIAFIAVDIDNFKTVNDTWGHKCGDMVLEEVSRTIAGTIREGDRIARWGGEEFLVILMKSGMDGAAVLAERMRKAVAATQVKFEETVVSVTASFGISMCGADCEPDDCLLRADRALYQGKKTGRNRVVCWTPDLDG